MKAECYVQVKPTFSRARSSNGQLSGVTVEKLTQHPPHEVFDGAAVVKLVFLIDDEIFAERRYPTVTIEVDKTVADLKPAVVTAMAQAKI